MALERMTLIMTITMTITLETMTITTTVAITLMEFDRPGERSPEKNCWW